MLIEDETADEKSSADAAGAARQYSGTVGGIALCQVAVIDAVLAWENIFSGQPETYLRVCGAIALLLASGDYEQRASCPVAHALMCGG
jgi:hypothetical protein